MSKEKTIRHPLAAHLGSRLRQLRMALGIAPLDAADLLGVTQQQISNLEIGYSIPSVVQLQLLAQFYDMPVSWFFREYQAPPEEQERIRLLAQRLPQRWQPEDAEEREAALLAVWRALPDDERRRRLMDLLEALLFVGGKGE